MTPPRARLARVTLALISTSLVVALSPPPSPLNPVGARQPYGHVIAWGHHSPIEYFRATFGGPIPCGARRVVFAPAADPFGCPPASPVATPANGVHSRLSRDGAAAAAAAVASGRVPSTPNGLPLCGALCDGSDSDAVRGAYVIVARGSCSFLEKAVAAWAAGAAGLLVATHEGGLSRVGYNVTDASMHEWASAITHMPIVLANDRRLGALRPPEGGRGGDVIVALRPRLDACTPLDDVAHKSGSDADAAAAAAAAAISAEAAAAAEEVLTISGVASPAWAAWLAAPRETDGGRVSARLTGAMGGTEEEVIVAATEMDAMLRAVTITVDGGSGDEDEGHPHSAGGRGVSGEGGGVSMLNLITSAVTAARSLAAHADGGEFALALFGAPALPRVRPLQLVLAEPLDACEPLTLRIPQGAGVLAERGTCTITQKARHIEAAGGALALIVNTLHTPCLAVWGNGSDAQHAPPLISAVPPYAAAVDGTPLPLPPMHSLCALPVSQPIDDNADPRVNITTALLPAAVGVPLMDAIRVLVAALTNASVMGGGGAVAAPEAGVALGGGGPFALTLSLTPSPTRGATWDSLVSMDTPAAWPSDAHFLTKAILHLLDDNHPLAPSGRGHAARYLYLRALLSEGGHAKGGGGATLVRGGADALKHAEALWRSALAAGAPEPGRAAAMSFKSSSLVPIGGGNSGSNSSLSLTAAATAAALAAIRREPTHAYLTQFLPPSQRSMSKRLEGRFRCRSEAGTTFTMAIPEFEPSTATDAVLTARLQTLLATQACLEKLAAHTARVTGQYFALLRDASTDDAVWRRQTRSLMGPYVANGESAPVADLVAGLIEAGEEEA